jgi:hypothetical protein
MSERIHALAQHLFGKATIEECDLSEVKGLANRYPYFASAQFLLLEKLKQEGSEEYNAQLQKAILYYPDPLEFQYFINSDRFYTEVNFDDHTSSATEAEDKFAIDEPKAPAVVEDEQNTQVFETAIIEDKELATGTIETEIPDQEPEPDREREAAIEPAVIEYQGPSSFGERETENEINDVIAGADNETGVSTSIESPGTQPGIEPGLLKDKLNVPVKDTGISFEPFHTVDYFASQGIKISQEELPKDKFGKQVKSFTEWLKTMKRLPATQLGTTVDAGTETKVQNMAQDSIHDANVWTEAMAEVWIKQGNRSKAIEVYNKLSLLNPSKRAYFATKIENLKRS